MNELRDAPVDADGFLLDPDDILLWFNRTFHVDTNRANGRSPCVAIENDVLVIEGDVRWRQGVADVTKRGAAGLFAARIGRLDGSLLLIGEEDRLTGLDGLPDAITGHFHCYAQPRLTSLAGGPTLVRGDVRVNSCGLVDCRGGPTEVGGEFDIRNNAIEKLAGAPSVVGSLNASGNQLTDLTGGPSTLRPAGRATRYLVHGNPLDSESGLDGLVVDGVTDGGVFTFPLSVKKQIAGHGAVFSESSLITLDSNNMRILTMGVARAEISKGIGLQHAPRAGRVL